jgi:acetyltransferase-like isoleucine patch superfamily enzyme
MIEIPFWKILTLGILPSFLKCFYYRLKGASIGTHVHFAIGSVLIGKQIRIGEGSRFGLFSIIVAERIDIGKRADIGSFTFLSGREVSLGDDCVVHELVFSGILDGPRSVLRIGSRVRIFPLTVINPTMGVTIEDDVGIGGYSLIFTHGAWQSVLQGYPVQYAPVTIRKGVWLPWDVFVMPGVTIGEGATIGARSLVTSDIPPRSLALGAPARVVKSGHEYPRSLSLEDKEAILGSIFREYVEYALYKGHLAEFEGTGNRFSLTIGAPQSPGAVICYARTSEGALAKPTGTSILVSLTGIDPQRRRQIEDNDMLWIDLMNEQRSIVSNPIVEDFVKFLFRYGIKALSGT